MNPYEIMTIVLLALPVCWGLFRWIGKIDKNTEATERLTTAFETFTARIDQRLTDHEQRISRLEGRR